MPATVERKNTNPALHVEALLRDTAQAAHASGSTFACCIALVLVPSVVMNLGIALFTRTWMDQAARGALDFRAAVEPWLTLLIVPYVVLVVLYPLTQAAITHSVVEHLGGRTVTAGDAFREAPRSVLALWLNGLLVGTVTMLATVLLILPGIYAALCLVLTGPVIVAEKVGPVRALRTSYELTIGHKLPIALLLLSIAGIGIAMSCCITGPLNFLLTATSGAQQPFALPDPRSAGPLALNVVRTTLFAALQLFATAGLAVVHARIRGMKRGADIASVTEVFG